MFIDFACCLVEVRGPYFAIVGGADLGPWEIAADRSAVGFAAKYKGN